MFKLSFKDMLIIEVDNALRSLLPPKKRPILRQSPAKEISDAHFSPLEKRHISGLMRVNHAGEICAQALYHGQAITAKQPKIRKQMELAAIEEIDHLAWCEQRLDELGAKPSIFNLFWYSASLLIGALTGLAGDKISLGFVAETERQVSRHLQHHLKVLPLKDKKTIAILDQMLADEQHHASIAVATGAMELPFLIRELMSCLSKLMTTSSYYI